MLVKRFIRAFISKVKAVFRGNRAAQDEAARSAYGVEMQELEEAARLWKQAYDAADETAKAVAGNNKAAQTDGEARYSIKYDQTNNPYVVIESDILAGVPRSQ